MHRVTAREGLGSGDVLKQGELGLGPPYKLLHLQVDSFCDVDQERYQAVPRRRVLSARSTQPGRLRTK